MIKSSLDSLMNRLNRKEIMINANLEPYLIRYILYGKKNNGKTYRGRGLYIQKLVDSDFKHARDYPWNWGRFVFKGQFIELVRNNDASIRVSKVKRFQMLYGISSRRAAVHRIVNNKNAWMFFWHGKYKHHWGFWINKNNKKIYWREYLKAVSRQHKSKN